MTSNNDIEIMNKFIENPELYEQEKERYEKLKELLTRYENTKKVDEKEEELVMSKTRKRWVVLSNIFTFYIPNFILSKNPEIRQAFREKMTLVTLIFLLASSTIFILAILPKIICPFEPIYTWDDIRSKQNEAWVIANGDIYDVKEYIDRQLHFKRSEFIGYLGQDISYMIRKPDPFMGIDREEVLKTPETSLYNLEYYDVRVNITEALQYEKNGEGYYVNQGYNNSVFNPVEAYCDREFVYCYTREQFNAELGDKSVGKVAWNFEGLIKDEETNFIVIYDNVYNISTYLEQGESNEEELWWNGRTARGSGKYMDDRFDELFSKRLNGNATEMFKELFEVESRDRALEYLDKNFYIGIIDTRFDEVCFAINIMFLISVGMIGLVLIIKFSTALFVLRSQTCKMKDDKVIIMMPCYTEDQLSLEKTINSVQQMNYEQKNKLLFVIADGLVKGSGNKKTTAEIVLDILGSNIKDEKTSYKYKSLGEETKKYNRGKVYTGTYHEMPYIVVVKVGNEGEMDRPGNRGKRDSQMVLYKYLSDVFYKNIFEELSVEMDRKINGLGMNIQEFEYIMCIDADTKADRESLKNMVYKMNKDTKIIGLCGEIKIENKMDSWVTAIQVYEYYINQNLSKAFESLFGMVTCLPGCFTMYRIKRNGGNGKKAKAFIIDKDILDEYSNNNVSTLHTKNLLHLGEDRFFTTLLLKVFPNKKLSYSIDAKCETIVPDTWGVLLSQRRRWINSTIHNLFELMMVPNMRGICCFSMRFIIFLDLFSTFLMPVMISYLYYLIVMFVLGLEKVDILLIIMTGAIYGLQVLIFVFKREFSYFFWMIIYIIAIPIWSIILPLYAFWKFDDFSWGKTREIEKETVELTSVITE